MNHRHHALALGLALALTACGAQDTAPGSAGEAAADSFTHVAPPTAECVNRVEGYAVRYPADWHVNSGEVLGPCALFHPDPFEVPRNSEVPMEIAIAIDFEPVPFARVHGDTIGRRDETQESTSVDGRAGVRVSSVSTGEGLHPPGIRSYHYFIDLGDTTMIATTYDAGTPSFEEKRAVLDAMMASFDFRQPG